jgi:AcrR family transcriptional regulator
MKTKSKAKRLALLEAAFAVVSEKGYFETTVDEVAHRAGVAKGTVYLYFKDKPAIYVGLVDWLLEQGLASVAEAMARPVSARRKLEDMFTTWTSGVFANPGVMALLSMENIHQASTVMKRFKKQVLPHLLEMQEAIAAVIQEGIVAGEFRPVDPSVAAMMYLSAFRSEMMAATNRPGVTRPDASVKELFFCGILADGRVRRTDGKRK